MKQIKTDTLSNNVKPGDDSDLGKDVSLPSPRDATEKGRVTSDTKASSGMSASTEPARLCYVDDSRTSAYVVKRMLRPFGYSVDHYESAEPALIALVQGSYDLLLTDLKVSPKGMDGDDLVRALRNSGQSKISDLPVIVITGSTDRSILANVYEAGANQIMTKPVNGEELNNHIRKLVYSHSTEQGETHFDLSNGKSEYYYNSFNDFSTDEEAGNKQEYEEVVLEDSNQEGFANFMGPTAFADKPANVVFFDSEIKQNKNIDIADTSQSVDDIPVLNPSDLNNPIPVLDSESFASSSSPANNSFAKNNVDRASDSENSADGDSNGVDSERRVLARGPVQKSSGLAPNQPVPKPATRSAPAAKVQPTITTVKPTADVGSDGIVKASISNTDARREAARRAQAAVTAAQKNKRIKAEKAKKKAQAAAALNKLKEAASIKAATAKKAQQIQQLKKQRAIAAAKAKAIAAAEKKKQQEAESLTAENLQLEPKEVHVSKPAHVTSSSSPASNASAAPEASSTTSASGQELTSTKPIELVHPRDGGSPLESGANSNSFTQQITPPPAATSSNSSSPQGRPAQAQQAPPAVDKTDYGSNDILSGMDQFPLVETDMADSYAPSRFFSAFGSLFELYGFKKIIVMTLGILVVFFTYDTWGPALNINDGTPVDLSIVEQGEIFQAITVPGKVVSKLRVNISPSIAGRLTKVLVDEGDTVSEGHLLARLDDREAKSYLKKATASFNSAKEDVDLAKRTLKRLKQAFKKGAVPRQLVEDAEVDLRSSTARKSISEEEVRTAKVNLENPRILAPFAGVVTNRFVEVGQWVVPSEALFTLIDPKQREVEVKVDSADSNGIAVGQTVSLSSDAFPGLEWSESVSRLAAATTNVGNANTITVYISLGTNSPSLRFGQQIDADIRTAWNPNAVKVPYGAIINRKGQTWVAVLEGDKARLVEVTTGIEDFSHVEITQGVSIGETIILADGKRLREGERVFLSTK